jgi:hypothetical protein
MKDNAAMSAQDRKDQMAVLSNTTSEEDYAKMQEDGFDLESTTGAVVVTETDKIKAQLAKAGVDISIFGDDPDMEQLEEITGSTELAAQIAEAMRKADLPLTEDNLKESVDALRMADSLETPNQGAMRYLVEQDIAPTIENLYFAEHSGDSQYMPQGQTIDFSEMTKQIEQVIEQAGYEVVPETVEDAKWLIENQVAFTPDRFSYYEELKGLSFPKVQSRRMRF